MSETKLFHIGDVLAFLATHYPRFGQQVPVVRIPEQDHTRISLIAGIKMNHDAIIVNGSGDDDA